MVRLFGSPQTSDAVAGEVEQLPGLSYMFWSVFQQRRDAILPGERFRLRLQTRPLPFAAVEVAGRKLEMADSFELAAASLWLLLRLGGVGARVRRGAGGMRAVVEPEGWPASLPSLVSSRDDPGRAGCGAERGSQAGAPGRRLAGATARRPVVVRHPPRARLSTLPGGHHLPVLVGGGELGRREVPGLPHRTQARCLAGLPRC